MVFCQKHTPTPYLVPRLVPHLYRSQPPCLPARLFCSHPLLRSQLHSFRCTPFIPLERRANIFINRFISTFYLLGALSIIIFRISGSFHTKFFRSSKSIQRKQRWIRRQRMLSGIRTHTPETHRREGL